MQTGFRTNFSWKRGFSMMLLTLFSFSVAVAQVLVRGTVVDQTGESVPGASIQIKGGTQGTITDLDGKFSLNAPNKKSILIVSFIGYVTQELPVETAKPMSIILKEDTKTLDEVVIVGYQEVKKNDRCSGESKYGRFAENACFFIRPDFGWTYCRSKRKFGRGYAGRNDEYRYPW